MRAHEMELQPVAQFTCETCLANSLLQFTSARITRSKELQVLNHALKFSKHSFAMGHLEWFVQEQRRSVRYYVSSDRHFGRLRRMRHSRRITLARRPVTLSLIKTLVKEIPVIVYVDAFALWKEIHYPHFIVVINSEGDKFGIFDPWDGEKRKITSETLAHGIRELRSLKIDPQLIAVQPL